MSREAALEILRAGRPQEAAALLEDSLRRQPVDARGWFLLGACRHKLRELAEAGHAFSRSLALDPSKAASHLAYITVLREAADAHGALAACRAALARMPGDAQLLYASALCLEDLTRDDEALAQYDAALQVDPRLEDAHHNRGRLLARLGDLPSAESSQRRYVEQFPDSPRALGGLADVLLALGRFPESLLALDAVERLIPGTLEILIRRGVAFASMRRFADARAAFAQARQRDSSAVDDYLQRVIPGSKARFMLSPENLYFWQCHLAFQRCDWTSWRACTCEMRTLPASAQAAVEPAIAFIAFHLPLSGPERHAVARKIAADVEREATPLSPAVAPREERLRIGILSPDYREHLNTRLLLPLFELCDRRRFELTAYSLGEDDGSEIRRKVASVADRFVDLRGSTDDESASLIRSGGIDILLDVAGHTMGGRFGITARRPAPVQAAYLGFAGSLGSRRVDYAIADRIVAPDPAEWSESLVHLPTTYFLYDFREPVPPVAATRRDYGLPDDQFVFCAFHKAEKISPDAFSLWMEILNQVPHSVLWMLSLPQAAQRNLRAEAGRLGVDPARLVFAPFDARERYLARQRLGDLMLDTLHHSAMTTACDAMAAGLPVLTMRGKAMASRAGESLARAAGVPQLVASSELEYARLGINLANDRRQLQELRRTLEARSGPLFDTGARVRDLEAAFETMWRDYQSRA